MNINGYCPHCNADFDGDLVTDYPRSQGKSEEEILDYAKDYCGWNEHGVNNRWCRKISISSLELDRVTHYKCPDCNKQWPRFIRTHTKKQQ